MPTEHIPTLEHGYINVPLYKGTLLRLTPTEYANGAKRGKRWLRATTHAAREAVLGAEREEALLAWMTEGEQQMVIEQQRAYEAALLAWMMEGENP